MTLAFFAWPTLLAAQTINWGGSIAFGTPNAFTSDGSAVPAGETSPIVWEVGVFRDPDTGTNWVPTAENVAEWSTFWVSLDQSGLQEVPSGDSVFYSWGGAATVTSANTNGLQLYIWAHGPIHKLATATGQTLLITGDPLSWRAPNLGSADFPPTIETTNATQAIFGRVDSNVDQPGGVLESTASFYTNLLPEGQFEVQLGSWAPSFQIVKQPLPVLVNAGETVQFEVEAEGQGPFSYKWYHDGQLVSDDSSTTGSSTALLNLLASADNAGEYSCLVANGVDEISSQSATLTVNQDPIWLLPNVPADWRVSGVWNFQVSAAFDVTRWLVSGLPPGVTFNPLTGKLTGRVTKAGIFPLKITAFDDEGASYVWEQSIEVQPLLEQTTGSFLGLLPRDPALGEYLGGSIAVVINPRTGRYSGSIIIGKQRFPFRGLINADFAGGAETSVEVKRKGMTPLLLSWTQSATHQTMEGSLTSSETPEQVVLEWDAVRNPWKKLAPANAFAGRYHLILEPISVADSAPQGSSYLVATINSRTGRISFAGRMADGNAIKGSSILSDNGSVPLYLRSKAGPATVLSWLEVAPDSLANQQSISGDGSWVRLPATSQRVPRNYGGGFAIDELTVMGGRYERMQRGQCVLNLDTTQPNAQASLTLGSLSLEEETLLQTAFEMKVRSLSSTQQLLILPPSGSQENPTNMRLKVNPSTGFLTGSFQLQSVIEPLSPTVSRRGSIHGLVLPFRNELTGFFLLPDLAPSGTLAPIQSGIILIQPKQSDPPSLN